MADGARHAAGAMRQNGVEELIGAAGRVALERGEAGERCFFRYSDTHTALP
jgi:hypothetical protein